MKILLISICSLLFFGTAFGQSTRLDSIENKIKQQSKSDTLKVRLILEYAKAAVNDNTTKLLPYLDEAINISKKQNFKKGLQGAYNYLQIYYSDRGEIEKAQMYTDTAFYYLQNDTSTYAMITLAWLHNNIAGRYFELADYQQAVEQLIKAATIFEKYQPDILAATYGNIALVYSYLQLYDRAMEYDKKAIAIAEKSGDSLLFTQRNIGYVARLIEVKKFNEAGQILDKIEPLVMKLKNNSTFIFYYQDRGIVCTNEKKYDEAFYFLEKSYQYTLLNDNKGMQLTVLDPLIDALLLKGRTQDSKKYIDTLLQKSIMYGMKEAELNAYKKLAEWYKMGKNYERANFYLEKHIALSDSLSSETMKQKIATLETRFNLKDRENVIKKLEAEKKLQQSLIRQKNTLNYILIGSAAALLMISLLSYRNYRHKQNLQQQRIAELETQQQLAATEAVLKGEEQERTRLAKDLHDGLGGMLSGIKYSMNTMKGNLIMTPDNAQAFERSMDMLDSSIKEMRRVAHNLMPEALVKFGLDTALKDFCNDIHQSGALNVTYQSVGMEGKEPDQTTAITIFRIVQELLNNTLKHAAAKNAIVQVNRIDDQLSVTVEDDGKGFNTAVLQQKGGIGWSNILNRIEFMKGKLDVQSAEGKGTSVHIEIGVS